MASKKVTFPFVPTVQTVDGGSFYSTHSGCDSGNITKVPRLRIDVNMGTFFILQQLKGKTQHREKDHLCQCYI